MSIDGLPSPAMKAEAAYGKLPFDRFVLDEWNYSMPVENDQMQWNEIATRWLRMGHWSRRPFHVAAYHLENATLDDARLPTPDQINRVLIPHQTTEERNRALTTPDGLWIRTCYEPELAPAYAEMSRSRLLEPWDAVLLLNNEDLDNVGDDWAKIFLRMPHIPDIDDSGIYHPDDDIVRMEIDYDPPNDVAFLPLYDADFKTKCVHFLLDKEALQRKMLRLIWLDEHGECVWWNWMELDSTQDFEGLRNGLGFGFNKFIEFADGDPRYLEKGVLASYG